MKRRKILTFMLGVLLSQASYCTSVNVTTDVNSGVLLGIGNVDVDGVLYDASFHNTFIEANSQFSTQSFATTASIELVNLFTSMNVFAPFISDPLLIRGCDIRNSLDSCVLFNTVAINTEGKLRGTGMFILSDQRVTKSDFGFGPKGENAQNIAYVNWTITAVPLPTAVLLFASAILGLFGYRRKQFFGQVI